MKKILAMLFLSGVSTAFASTDDSTNDYGDDFGKGYKAGLQDGVNSASEDEEF